jgi:hypothetical protein
MDDPTTGDVVCTACGLVAPDDRVFVDGDPPHRRDPRPARAEGVIGAGSLLATAGRAVARQYGLDATLVLLEATRGGVPSNARGHVAAALCRAVARLAPPDCPDAQQA